MTQRYRHAFPLARSVVMAAVALGASGAHANDEDLPLFLTLSQSVRQDSNFSRNAAEASETVSTTSVGGGFSKSYGRQTYRLAGTLGAQRYRNFEYLRNDTKRLDGQFTSEFGRNFKLSLGGQYNQGLNPIQNNNNGELRVVRNIRTLSGTSASLQYGLGGRFSLVGSVENNKQTFSEPAYRTLNLDQQARAARVLYNVTDTLQWGVGLRRVETDYPYRNNEQVRDNNIDFQVGWQATGQSSLDAVLSRRDSRYSITGRKLNSWVGSLNWEFTPRGLIVYRVGLSRSTGSDRYTQRQSFLGSGFDANFDYNTITTGVNMSARYQPTAKIGLTAAYSYAKYDVNRAATSRFDNGAVVDAGSTQRSSHFSELSLAGDYAAMRSLKLGCNVSRYDQTADFFRRAFSGHAYGCTATFTLD
ncbi:hypothetical protein [uncultured Aquabacterium sp.]|jgi:hypothetical protein|uniref:hypothetical protein n=1 Tax=uncultured Aquabacterium sp. TaxID=158753 RepID=UPI002635E97E|nr:hypothetical protein [uncultured Aquabacterium sp.]